MYVGVIPSAYTSAVLIRTVIPSFGAVIFSELVVTVLRSARHEEQTYNSCNGILHSCKDVPLALVEEAVTNEQNLLCERLRQMKLSGMADELENQLARLDLLTIDDFGLMELDLDKCRDLFEVIDSRDSLKSTMIVFSTSCSVMV